MLFGDQHVEKKSSNVFIWGSKKVEPLFLELAAFDWD